MGNRGKGGVGKGKKTRGEGREGRESGRRLTSYTSHSDWLAGRSFEGRPSRAQSHHRNTFQTNTDL